MNHISSSVHLSRYLKNEYELWMFVIGNNETSCWPDRQRRDSLSNSWWSSLYECLFVVTISCLISDRIGQNLEIWLCLISIHCSNIRSRQEILESIKIVGPCKRMYFGNKTQSPTFSLRCLLEQQRLFVKLDKKSFHENCWLAFGWFSWIDPTSVLFTELNMFFCVTLSEPYLTIISGYLAGLW